MPEKHEYFVYLITNKYNTVIYTGVTNNLQQRIWQHREGVYDGFSKKYGCYKLVYYETFQWIQEAIAREKLIKGGSKQAKIDLIIRENPDWNDLGAAWFD